MRSNDVAVVVIAALLVMAGVACSKGKATDGEPTVSKVPAGAAYLGVAGSGLVRIAPDGSMSRIGPKISQFYEIRADPDGTVYASSLDGLFRFAEGTASKIDMGIYGDILRFDFSADGTLIGATYGEIVRRDGDQWTKIDTSALGEDEKHVQFVFAMPTGIWAFAETHAYFRAGYAADGQFELKDPAPAIGQIRRVVRTPTDELIAITDEGVFTFDAAGWSLTDPAIEASIRAAVGPDGTLYLSRVRGNVDRFRRERGALTALPGLEIKGIDFFAETIAVDRRGRVWQGDTRGVYITDGDRTRVLSKDTSPLIDGPILRLLVLEGGPALR